MPSHTKTDAPADHVVMEPGRASSRFDEIVARYTQALPNRTPSRRSFLAFVGRLALTITGASLVHILPIDREIPVTEATASDCNSWYMCGAYIDRVCSCACGSNSCPSEGSCTTVTQNFWTSCCWDGRRWWEIRYYDCCTQGCKP